VSLATASRRSTILVVEDEAGIARMIQVLLEARGFGALVTHSGDEALQCVAEHRVDLVLLDVMMPGMDGYEVCRRLKSDARTRHIPVVMLTAKDAVRDMVLGLEIGADEYITKPFNTDELIARVKVLLRIQGMSLELLRRNQELQALNAVALSVSRSLSLEKILEGALAGTLHSLGLESGLVHLVDSRSGDLELQAEQGPAAPAEVRRLPPGPSWAWQVLDAEEPLVLADAGQAAGLGRPACMPAEPLAAVALRFQERRLGVLTVVGRPGQPFTPDELGLLGAIARQVSLALENARLYSQSRRKAQEFEALYQVSRAMASSLELQEILERISRSVSGLLEGRAMSLMLLGQDGHSLTTVAGYNLPDETPELGGGRAAANSPSFAAVRKKRPITIPDLGQDDGYAEWAAAMLARGYRAFLAIPLVVQDRALGCMNVYATAPHVFSADEVQLFSTFASQAAVSIENARLFEETRQLAITDPLTGLANHRQFYNQLSREVRRAQRYDRPLSLLMLDLDHFKQFNDQYGHLAGDQALREVADVLRQNARSVDILARYGGEEFALILPETDLKRATFQAERVRTAVAAFAFLGASGGGPGSLTVSIGVAALQGKMRKGQDLVHDADQALYRAKAAGRNRMESAPA
jgi:diguanylate cyclase (GGDEF)-like protein